MIRGRELSEDVAKEVQDFICRSEVARGDMEYCAGLFEIQEWAVDGQPQALLEKALAQIKTQKLGHAPDSEIPAELLRARFARSGEKIVRTAINATNKWHDRNFYSYKPEGKVGRLPYHCQS